MADLVLSEHYALSGFIKRQRYVIRWRDVVNGKFVSFSTVAEWLSRQDSLEAQVALGVFQSLRRLGMGRYG